MYSECITCAKIGKTCDGPNFMAMSAQQLLTWCKSRKNYLGLSNAQLAEMSNMPKGSIDRLFAGEHADFRFETIRPMIKVLVGGDWSGEPCPDPTSSEKAVYEERIRQLEKDLVWREDKIQQLQKTNASLELLVTNTNARTTKDKDFLRKQLDDRYQFLKRKDRVIVILSVLLALCVLLIIGALIIDRINPDIGFLWLRSWFGGDGGTLNIISQNIT